MNLTKFDLTIDARMISNSGIGTYLKNLVPDLIDEYNLSVLGNPNIINTFPWSGGVNIIEAKSPIYSLREQNELPSIIPECKLFISPHYNIPNRKIKAQKRLVVIHDVNHLAGVYKISTIKKLYANYMIKAAITKSDIVITDSEFSKSEILKYTGLSGKEIKVIYCGLDIEELKKRIDESSVQRVKEKYNLPEKYFLYVGSIKPHKNLKLLIEASNIFLEQYPEMKLVIAGVNTEQFELYKQTLKFTEKVFLPGFILDSEFPVLYKNAECLIFPSYYEGFGLPPLEAMICGCPVITSNAASLPEVCGDAALYFNPFKVDELINTLNRFMGDKKLREELVNKGYRNCNQFNTQRFVKEFKEEINKIILS